MNHSLAESCISSIFKSSVGKNAYDSMYTGFTSNL